MGLSYFTSPMTLYFYFLPSNNNKGGVKQE